MNADTLSEVTVTATAQEAAALARLSPSGSFSCSPDGQVWAETTKGLHSPYQRHQLAGVHSALDRAVALLLRGRPRGGRFAFVGGTVEFADGNEPFALWELHP